MTSTAPGSSDSLRRSGRRHRRRAYGFSHHLFGLGDDCIGQRDRAEAHHDVEGHQETCVFGFASKASLLLTECDPNHFRRTKIDMIAHHASPAAVWHPREAPIVSLSKQYVATCRVATTRSCDSNRLGNRANRAGFRCQFAPHDAGVSRDFEARAWRFMRTREPEPLPAVGAGPDRVGRRANGEAAPYVSRDASCRRSAAIDRVGSSQLPCRHK